MRSCAVSSCGNNTSKRPDLCFFSLPRDSFLRDEWLEVLRINRREHINHLAVCELHFKEKDFRAGKKKDLKTHAVPVLKLGAGKVDPYDSDEDFIPPFGSDSDPEIIEIKAEIHVYNEQKIKQQPPVENVKQEPSRELEPETGRRPSRKAALVAAKKIFNTVRSFGVNDDDPPDLPVITTTSPKPTSTPHPYTRPKPKKTPPVNVDLQMECCDDFLSPIQAEVLLKAQIQYNMVMKNLRELMACNVKVIQTDPFGLPMPTTVAPVSNVALKTINVPSNVKLARSKAIKIGTAVVPMALSRASSQSAPIIMI